MNLKDHFEQYTSAVNKDSFDKSDFFEWLKIKKSSIPGPQSEFDHLSAMYHVINNSIKSGDIASYKSTLISHQKTLLLSLAEYTKVKAEPFINDRQKYVDFCMATTNRWRFSSLVVEMSIEGNDGKFYIIPRYSSMIDQSKLLGVISVREYELLCDISTGKGSGQQILLHKKEIGYPTMILMIDGKLQLVKLSEVNKGQIRDWTLSLCL